MNALSRTSSRRIGVADGHGERKAVKLGYHREDGNSFSIEPVDRVVNPRMIGRDDPDRIGIPAHRQQGVGGVLKREFVDESDDGPSMRVQVAFYRSCQDVRPHLVELAMGLLQQKAEPL